jgi:hypothetical protein
MTYGTTLFKGDLRPLPRNAAKFSVPVRVNPHEIYVCPAAGYNVAVRAIAIF